MKIRLSSIIVFAILVSTAITPAAESKRTANYLLTTPFTYEGKEVTVDVAFVKPIHWVCPIPGMTFFHAMTINRSSYKPGGVILVAIASSEAASFAKKYGTEPRRDADTLKGTFLAVGGRRPGLPPGAESATSQAPGPGPGKKIWVIDTTGQLQKLMEQNKLEIPHEVADAGPGPGPGGGPGHGNKPGPGPR